MSEQIPVCRFCGDCDEEHGGQIDGGRFSWLTTRRDCCNRYACQSKNAAAKKQVADAVRQATRKRTPAQIEELKRQERAARRRRNRQAATARGLLKPKGGQA